MSMKKQFALFSTLLLLGSSMPVGAFAEGNNLVAENSSVAETTAEATTAEDTETTATSETTEATEESTTETESSTESSESTTTESTETSGTETTDSTTDSTSTSTTESTTDSTSTSTTESTTDSTSTSTTESSTTPTTTPSSSKEQPKPGTSTSESKQPAKPVTPTAPAEKPVEQPAASTPQPEIVPPVTNETVGLVEDDETFTVSKTKKTEEFIQEIGESARKVAKDKNLYASVMIAQAILESGSGNSKLSQKPNYNLFGIKGDYKGQSVSFITYEDNGFGNLYTVEAKFRQYPTYKESMEDYAKLLKNGLDSNKDFYHGVWKTEAKSYKEATRFLTGKYATDKDYHKKLNALIKTYDLTYYDKEKATVEPMESNFPAYNGKNYDTFNSYAWGNCTQYVYNRITQLGKRVDLTMGNGQDWGETGRARGYKVSRTPKAGAAVSFPAGVLGADNTYGHVAFVEKVFKDGSILISEMNVKELNVVSTRTISADETHLMNYIVPKDK
ncbi:glucosaminidase domain-containing protein [Enterococcus faecalis]|uniref:glucosaminidase domain-containing protein n=1 Tax=Enterococcus faecalis TaxID=1351 RepID=UPI0001F0CA19|nr:glucosaminidase domain-containing protein [Enterococcus faecalis]EFT95138.1 CHAP domain protein [Enterococcus faecalis TX0012]